jgi:hypothetical protein
MDSDMIDMNFIKIKQPTASAICNLVELDEEAKQLLQDDAAPAQYFQQLIEKELYPDAVRFLAVALPKREAIWWACLCVRHALGESPSQADVKAIELAEAWVYKPTEENRQLTMPAAEATQFKTSAGWAAVAAFWSGGSISPAAGAIVPPADDLTGKAVIGAIMLAAVQSGVDKIKANYRLFLEKGINIANGGDGRTAQ